MRAIRGVKPVHAPKVFGIRLIRTDRLEARLDGIRDARRIGKLAPSGQRHLRGAEAFDRRAPALAIVDFRPDEEWCRHGADTAPSACISAERAARNEAR